MKLWAYAPPRYSRREKEESEVAVTSKHEKIFTRQAKSDDLTVQLAHSGNDVVKNLSELEVEEKGAAETENNAADDQETIAANGDADENMTDDPPVAGSSSAAATTGEKRAADEDKADEEPSKKAKVGRGRPKKVTATLPATKKAATPKAKGAEKKTDTAAAKKAEAEAAKKVEKAEKAAEKKAEADAKKVEKAEADAAKKAEAGAKKSEAKGEAAGPEEPLAANEDEPAPTTTKKGRGRPKKDEKTAAEPTAAPASSSTTAAPTPKAKGASKKATEKKERPVPNGTGVGSRTRSSKKWKKKVTLKEAPPSLRLAVSFSSSLIIFKKSLTLGFTASASPFFMKIGPLFRSPLPFPFFATSDNWLVWGRRGFLAKRRERNGKGGLGKRKEVAGPMVGWLGDMRVGWEWIYLIPSYNFLSALSVRLSREIICSFFQWTPTYFLLGLCDFAVQAD